MNNDQLMTEEEIHEFGIQVVAEQIQKEGFEILSITTDKEYYPQIVAKKDERLGFIIVKTACYPKKGELNDPALINDLLAYAKKCDATCFFASVGIANSEAEEDEGLSIPIKGAGFYVSYEGLELLDFDNTDMLVSEFYKTIEDLMEFEELRRQHYYFAHRYLRDKAADNPERTFDELTADGGTRYLRSVWAAAGFSVKAAEDDFIPADQIECFPVPLNEYCSAVIVQLPPPERMTEAYFIGLIVWHTNAPVSANQSTVTHRYFVLELGRNGKRKRTVLAEWVGEDHLNYGDGPIPDKDAFIEAILGIAEIESVV